jgi:RNA polymerase sigma-70 factor (ECF subfamily)
VNGASYKNEDDFIKSCCAGDEKAWGCLIEHFSPLVRWAIRDKIYSVTGFVNESDIDDIFQQTFTHIWCNQKLKSLKNTNSISAYLVIIAQNRAIDFLRRHKRLSEPKDDKVFGEAPKAHYNPRLESHNKQLHEVIEYIIEALPLKERRIITLDLFYDFKHRQIAEFMGMPINTVSTIIKRAKDFIKEKLKKEGYDV